MKKIPLIVAALALALVTAATAGRAAERRRARRDRLLARPDRFGAEDDPRARREVQQDASRHRRARSAGLERRLDDAEARGGHRLRQLPRSRVRLRLRRAGRGAVEQGRRHLEGHQGDRLRVEQPVRGGSQHRDRRREGRRLPRRDRQPRGGLQQEAPQGGRRRAAEAGLDVERLPRAGQEAHQSRARTSSARASRSRAARTPSGGSGR